MNSVTPLQRQLLADFARGAEIFPHQYNPLHDQILLVRLSDAAVRDASFLDERVLPQGAQGAWVSADMIAEAAAGAPAIFADRPAAYIFHAGHCGSTLVSRLLGAASDAAGLREPLPLRAFAVDRAEGGGAVLSAQMLTARLGLFEKIWARGGPSIVVKATSICTGLAAPVIARPQRRAIFLTQHPETHLAVLLAGRNAANDLRAFAQLRWRRLNAMTPLPPLADYSLGEMAALAWLTEGAAASEAALALFDFEQLLAAPAQTLSDMAAALTIDASSERIDAAVSGPILRQYSKSPDHAYDAALRDEIIAQSRSQHPGEISKGMAWLARVAAVNPVARACLDRWSA